MTKELLQQARRVGEKGAKHTESERLLFEQYMQGHCWACDTWDAEKLEYADMHQRILYAVFRARAAIGQPANTLVEVVKDKIAQMTPSETVAFMQARAAIAKPAPSIEFAYKTFDEFVALNDACDIDNIDSARQGWNAFAKIHGALPEQQVPEGMCLVPIKPTQSMCIAGQDKAAEWPRFPLRINPIY